MIRYTSLAEVARGKLGARFGPRTRSTCSTPFPVDPTFSKIKQTPKSQILLGKGWGQWRARKNMGNKLECKTFLNGNGGTSKERKYKTREKQSKGKKRL
jgi:hypothetical protein